MMIIKSCLTIVPLLLVLGSLTTADRILVFFIHIGGSHFHAFYPLFNALAERGHNVTVLSYFHVKNPHSNYNELILNGMPQINNSLTFDELMYPGRSIYKVFAEFFELYNWGLEKCEAAFNSSHIDLILATHAAEPYDLLLTEAFETDCMLGLIHKMNVPFIGLSTCALPPWNYDRVALPDFPSYIPFAFIDYSWEMDWRERTVNWLVVKSMKLLYRLIQMNDNKLIRKRFGDEIPDVSEIANKISLIMVNQHYSYAGPKPLSTQVIEVSGIHLKSPKPLPNKLQELLDNADDGAIVVSWGSSIKSSSMPIEVQREILKGFAELPLQIIWKWENTAISNVSSSNVYTTEWLPQQDVLCHPNVKAFWSHGGNLGVIEAVHCGIPLIVTPIYGDQFMNAASLARRGMGFLLRFEEITADNIHNTIKKALDPKIYQTAKQVSFEHQNRLATPLDTAIWWAEHTLATGGIELVKLNGLNEMHWLAYYSIDAIVLLSIPILLIVWIIWRTLTVCFSLVKKCKTIEKDKRKKNL